MNWNFQKHKKILEDRKYWRYGGGVGLEIFLRIWEWKTNVKLKTKKQK